MASTSCVRDIFYVYLGNFQQLTQAKV